MINITDRFNINNFSKDRIMWRLNRCFRKWRQWLINLKFTKIVAVFTAVCFLTSFVFGPAAHALVEKTRENGKLSRITDEFVIPYTAGRITDARCYDSQKVVVNIQDLHCHGEVQKNISKVLSLLDEKYKLSRIYVEGAIGEVDTSWITSIKDKDLRNEIVESLISQGRLTGAEYYSVMSQRPDMLRGLEDEKIYKDNILRLNKILSNRRAIESIINNMQADIEVLKKRYYGSKHKKLEKLIKKHKDGKLTTEKYYSKLKKYADKLDEDIYAYENIIILLDMMELHSKLNFKKISNELQKFISFLKQKLPYKAYRFLAEKMHTYSKLDELYVYLIRIAHEYKINLTGRYPSLDRFFEYVTLSQRINPIELIREEDVLVRELHLKLSKSGTEKEIVFLISFFKHLQSYLGNKISAEDYDYFSKNLERFEVLWEKHVDATNITMFRKYFGLLDKYYKANIERNICFINNVFGKQKHVKSSSIFVSPYADQCKRTLETMKDAKDIIVMVTGGFHTDGLASLLSDREISYMVITPNVTQDTKFADQVYNRLAREQAEMLANMKDRIQESGVRTIPHRDRLGDRYAGLGAALPYPTPELIRVVKTDSLALMILSERPYNAQWRNILLSKFMVILRKHKYPEEVAALIQQEIREDSFKKIAKSYDISDETLETSTIEFSEKTSQFEFKNKLHTISLKFNASAKDPAEMISISAIDGKHLQEFDATITDTTFRTRGAALQKRETFLAGLIDYYKINNVEAVLAKFQSEKWYKQALIYARIAIFVTPKAEHDELIRRFSKGWFAILKFVKDHSEGESWIVRAYKFSVGMTGMMILAFAWKINPSGRIMDFLHSIHNTLTIPLHAPLIMAGKSAAKARKVKITRHRAQKVREVIRELSSKMNMYDIYLKELYYEEFDLTYDPGKIEENLTNAKVDKTIAKIIEHLFAESVNKLNGQVFSNEEIAPVLLETLDSELKKQQAAAKAKSATRRSGRGSVRMMKPGNYSEIINKTKEKIERDEKVNFFYRLIVGLDAMGGKKYSWIAETLASISRELMHMEVHEIATALYFKAKGDMSKYDEWIEGHFTEDMKEDQREKVRKDIERGLHWVELVLKSVFGVASFSKRILNAVIKSAVEIRRLAVSPFIRKKKAEEVKARVAKIKKLKLPKNIEAAALKIAYNEHFYPYFIDAINGKKADVSALYHMLSVIEKGGTTNDPVWQRRAVITVLTAIDPSTLHINEITAIIKGLRLQITMNDLSTYEAIHGIGYFVPKVMALLDKDTDSESRQLVNECIVDLLQLLHVGQLRDYGYYITAALGNFGQKAVEKSVQELYKKRFYRSIDLKQLLKRQALLYPIWSSTGGGGNALLRAYAIEAFAKVSLDFHEVLRTAREMVTHADFNQDRDKYSVESKIESALLIAARANPEVALPVLLELAGNQDNDSYHLRRIAIKCIAKLNIRSKAVIDKLIEITKEDREEYYSSVKQIAKEAMEALEIDPATRQAALPKSRMRDLTINTVHRIYNIIASMTGMTRMMKTAAGADSSRNISRQDERSGIQLQGAQRAGNKPVMAGEITADSIKTAINRGDTVKDILYTIQMKRRRTHDMPNLEETIMGVIDYMHSYNGEQIHPDGKRNNQVAKEVLVKAFGQQAYDEALTIWRTNPSYEAEDGFRIKLNSQEAILVIKADAAKKPKLVRATKTFLRDNGFKLARAPIRINFTDEMIGKFYKEHEGKFFYEKNKEVMTSGPCIAFILRSRYGAQKRLRERVGNTNGTEPGTLRYILREMKVTPWVLPIEGTNHTLTMNKVHCPGTTDENAPLGEATELENGARELSILLDLETKKKLFDENTGELKKTLLEKVKEKVSLDKISWPSLAGAIIGLIVTVHWVALVLGKYPDTHFLGSGVIILGTLAGGLAGALLWPAINSITAFGIINRFFEYDIEESEVMEMRRVILSVNSPRLLAFAEKWLPASIVDFIIRFGERINPIEDRYSVKQSNRTVYTHYGDGTRIVDRFKTYVITDLKTDSSIEIVPDKGNQLISFKVIGKEMLYFDQVGESGGILVMAPFIDIVTGNKFEDPSVKGRFVPLGSGNLVGKYTKKDKQGTVYHGMTRYINWQAKKISFNKEGISIKSVIRYADHEAIADRFEDGEVRVTYKLGSNTLSARSEFINKLVAAPGTHPWINIEEDDDWYVMAPAKSYINHENMEPKEVGREHRMVFPVEGTKQDLRTFQPLSKFQKNDDSFILTDLEADENGIATAYMYNRKDGRLIKVQQNVNQTPFMVLWAPKGKPFFAIESLVSSPNALNFQKYTNGKELLNPILTKKHTSEVSYNVELRLDENGKPLHPMFLSAQLGVTTTADIRPGELDLTIDLVSILSESSIDEISKVNYALQQQISDCNRVLQGGKVAVLSGTDQLLWIVETGPASNNKLAVINLATKQVLQQGIDFNKKDARFNIKGDTLEVRNGPIGTKPININLRDLVTPEPPVILEDHPSDSASLDSARDRQAKPFYDNDAPQYKKDFYVKVNARLKQIFNLSTVVMATVITGGVLTALSALGIIGLSIYVGITITGIGALIAVSYIVSKFKKPRSDVEEFLSMFRSATQAVPDYRAYEQGVYGDLGEVDKWLSDDRFEVSERLKKEWDDPKSGMIIKEYDIRGHKDVFTDGRTESLIEAQLAAAIKMGDKNNKKVFVGADQEDYNQTGVKIAIEKASKAGFEVIYVNRPCTSPAAYMAALKYGCDNIIFFSASHNPYGDKGMKVGIKIGTTFGPFGTKLVHEIAKQGLCVKTAKESGKVEEVGFEKLKESLDYYLRVHKGLGIKLDPEKLFVMVNPIFGTAGRDKNGDSILEYILQNMGFVKGKSYDFMNGNMKSSREFEDLGQPNPELTWAKTATRKELNKIDKPGRTIVGTLHDRDADRQSIVDKNSESSADKLGILAARQLAVNYRTKNPDDKRKLIFYVDLKCSMLVFDDPVLKKLNVEVRPARTGHSFLKWGLRKEGVNEKEISFAGFEQSGHCFYRMEDPDKPGTFHIVEDPFAFIFSVLQYLQENNMSLEDALKTVAPYESGNSVKFYLDGKKFDAEKTDMPHITARKYSIMKDIVKEKAEGLLNELVAGGKYLLSGVADIDGDNLRFFFTDKNKKKIIGSVTYRPSSNEEVLTINVDVVNDLSEFGLDSSQFIKDIENFIVFDLGASIADELTTLYPTKENKKLGIINSSLSDIDRLTYALENNWVIAEKQQDRVIIKEKNTGRQVVINVERSIISDVEGGDSKSTMPSVGERGVMPLTPMDVFRWIGRTVNSIIRPNLELRSTRTTITAAGGLIVLGIGLALSPIGIGLIGWLGSLGILGIAILGVGISTSSWVYKGRETVEPQAPTQAEIEAEVEVEVEVEMAKRAAAWKKEVWDNIEENLVYQKEKKMFHGFLRFNEGDLNLPEWKKALKREDRLNKLILEKLEEFGIEIEDIDSRSDEELEKLLIDVLSGFLTKNNIHGYVEKFPDENKKENELLSRAKKNETLTKGETARLNVAIICTIYRREIQKSLYKEIKANLKHALDIIEQKMAEGKIMPEKINLKLSKDHNVDPIVHGHARVGTFALAANPLHWGQIVTAFEEMAQKDLSKVVFILQGPGDVDKPEMDITLEERREMAEEFLKIFGGVFEVSTVSYDTKGRGEKTVFDLSELNKDAVKKEGDSLTFAYLVGSDHQHYWKEKVIKAHQGDYGFFSKDVIEYDFNKELDTIGKFHQNIVKKRLELDKRRHKIEVFFNVRPGQESEYLPEEKSIVDEVGRLYRFESFKGQWFEASSTEIRNWVMGEHSPEALITLPKMVREYIDNDGYKHYKAVMYIKAMQKKHSDLKEANLESLVNRKMFLDEKGYPIRVATLTCAESELVSRDGMQSAVDMAKKYYEIYEMEKNFESIEKINDRIIMPILTSLRSEFRRDEEAARMRARELGKILAQFVYSDRVQRKPYVNIDGGLKVATLCKREIVDKIANEFREFRDSYNAHLRLLVKFYDEISPKILRLYLLARQIDEGLRSVELTREFHTPLFDVELRTEIIESIKRTDYHEAFDWVGSLIDVNNKENLDLMISRFKFLEEYGDKFNITERYGKDFQQKHGLNMKGFDYEFALLRILQEKAGIGFDQATIITSQIFNRPEGMFPIRVALMDFTDQGREAKPELIRAIGGGKSAMPTEETQTAVQRVTEPMESGFAAPTEVIEPETAAPGAMEQEVAALDSSTIDSKKLIRGIIKGFVLSTISAAINEDTPITVDEIVAKIQKLFSPALKAADMRKHVLGKNVIEIINTLDPNHKLRQITRDMPGTLNVHFNYKLQEEFDEGIGNQTSYNRALFVRDGLNVCDLEIARMTKARRDQGKLDELGKVVINLGTEENPINEFVRISIGRLNVYNDSSPVVMYVDHDLEFERLQQQHNKSQEYLSRLAAFKAVKKLYDNPAARAQLAKYGMDIRTESEDGRINSPVVEMSDTSKVESWFASMFNPVLINTEDAVYVHSEESAKLYIADIGSRIEGKTHEAVMANPSGSAIMLDLKPRLDLIKQLSSSERKEAFEDTVKDVINDLYKTIDLIQVENKYDTLLLYSLPEMFNKNKAEFKKFAKYANLRGIKLVYGRDVAIGRESEAIGDEVRSYGLNGIHLMPKKPLTYEELKRVKDAVINNADPGIGYEFAISRPKQGGRNDKKATLAAARTLGFKKDIMRILGQTTKVARYNDPSMMIRMRISEKSWPTIDNRNRDFTAEIERVFNKSNVGLVCLDLTALFMRIDGSRLNWTKLNKGLVKAVAKAIKERIRKRILTPEEYLTMGYKAGINFARNKKNLSKEGKEVLTAHAQESILEFINDENTTIEGLRKLPELEGWRAFDLADKARKKHEQAEDGLFRGIMTVRFAEKNCEYKGYFKDEAQAHFRLMGLLTLENALNADKLNLPQRVLLSMDSGDYDGAYNILESFARKYDGVVNDEVLMFIDALNLYYMETDDAGFIRNVVEEIGQDVVAAQLKIKDSSLELYYNALKVVTQFLDEDDKQEAIQTGIVTAKRIDKYYASSDDYPDSAELLFTLSTSQEMLDELFDGQIKVNLANKLYNRIQSKFHDKTLDINSAVLYTTLRLFEEGRNLTNMTPAERQEIIDPVLASMLSQYMPGAFSGHLPTSNPDAIADTMRVLDGFGQRKELFDVEKLRENEIFDQVASRLIQVMG